MPRRVVTLERRSQLLGRRRRRQDQVLAALGERYRLDREDAGVKIHFPKQRSWAEIRAEVVAELDRIDPNWPRLFRVYPREGS